MLLLYFLVSAFQVTAINTVSEADLSNNVLESLLKTGLSGLNLFRNIEKFYNNELKDHTPDADQEYDFIVVGAGSAGATIASRLSEIQDATVLLIESGSNENFVMDIPILVPYLQFSNDINWKYQTESSEAYCKGMKNQKCNWPRGKVVGGSSVLNYMIATRGISLDYDEWSNMGNTGWSYAEVLKYFKKLEDFGSVNLRNKEIHNTGGPVYMNYSPYHTPLAESFLKAGLEMGYPVIDDNVKQDIGFSYLLRTIKNGSRMSTNRAYLHPLLKSKNLFLTKFSKVNKVYIDRIHKRAYGVEFSKFGKTLHVRAKKEIILSAGAIGSPQILMLSGIGPSEHLKEMKINVIQDAPVGDNLMDHIAYGGLVFLINETTSINAKNLLNPFKPHINNFFRNQSGPYNIPGACEALAFVNVDDSEKLDIFPNVELLFISSSMISDTFIRHIFGISDEYWQKMFAKYVGHDSWTIFPMILRPKSRGKILLRNKDPNTKPKIFANYLDNPEDVKILIKAIRAAIQVSKTEAMQKFQSKLFSEMILGCEEYTYDSDKYWECALRTFTFTIYHHAGTCKMAPENDSTGVVNPKLQVKGIGGLRVADASIMPTIISGHTNIPTIMIGEKAADMIKEDWGYDTT